MWRSGLNSFQLLLDELLILFEESYLFVDTGNFQLSPFWKKNLKNPGVYKMMRSVAFLSPWLLHNHIIFLLVNFCLFRMMASIWLNISFTEARLYLKKVHSPFLLFCGIVACEIKQGLLHQSACLQRTALIEK